MAESSTLTIYDCITAWNGLKYVKDRIDERDSKGELVPPDKCEIAAKFFAGIPSQEKDYMLSWTKKEPTEEEYPFLPLLEKFPDLSSTKESVDKGSMPHFKGFEKTFKPVVYNIVVTGLQYAGKTFTVGGLVPYLKDVIKEEKERAKYEQVFNSFVKELEEGRLDPTVVAPVIKNMQELGEKLKLHKERNSLNVLAASTDIREESMGEKAEPSKNVERVTIYYDRAIIHFIILPGQTSYKKYTSKVFKLYSETQTANGAKDEGKEENIIDIDPFLEESEHNYVLLFANIDENKMFDGKMGMELMEYVWEKQGHFAEVSGKLSNWGEEYDKLRHSRKGSPNPGKLMEKINEMTKEIEGIGFYQLAKLFKEAAIWDVYSIDHPNTKVMGLTFTGIDLKDKVGRRIMENFGKKDEKLGDEDWEALLKTISDFISRFVPNYRSEYFKLSRANTYNQGDGSPLAFLMQLDNNLKNEIQREVIDKQIDDASLSSSELQTLVRLGFDLHPKYLKIIFDDKDSPPLADPYLINLVKGYPKLGIRLEKLLELRRDGYKIPETYSKIVDEELRKSADKLISLQNTMKFNAKLGEKVDIGPLRVLYDEVKDAHSPDKQKEIENNFKEIENIIKESEKKPVTATTLDLETAYPSATAPKAPEEGEILDFRRGILKKAPPKKGVGGELLQEAPLPTAPPTQQPPKTDKPLSQRDALQQELKALFSKRKI